MSSSASGGLSQEHSCIKLCKHFNFTFAMNWKQTWVEWSLVLLDAMYLCKPSSIIKMMKYI